MVWIKIGINLCIGLTVHTAALIMDCIHICVYIGMSLSKYILAVTMHHLPIFTSPLTGLMGNKYK